MKTGGGDFSAEAYELMREAYSKEQQRAVDDELKGTQLMGQEYGLETLPVDSPWSDKIENWEYPSGKGQYIDEHQSPDEILEIMRGAAQERIEADEEEEEAVSDEELTKLLTKFCLKTKTKKKKLKRSLSLKLKRRKTTMLKMLKMRTRAKWQKLRMNLRLKLNLMPTWMPKTSLRKLLNSGAEIREPELYQRTDR